MAAFLVHWINNPSTTEGVEAKNVSSAAGAGDQGRQQTCWHMLWGSKERRELGDGDRVIRGSKWKQADPEREKRLWDKKKRSRMAGRKGEECVTHRIPSQKDMDRQTVYREEEEREQVKKQRMNKKSQDRNKRGPETNEREKLMHPEPLYKYHLRNRWWKEDGDRMMERGRGGRRGGRQQKNRKILSGNCNL